MPTALESCLNCGAVPESGSPLGLCSRCLMERLFEAPSSEVEDENEPGGFVTIREVAQGGMGNVVEVRDRSLKRSVAMKVMRDDARASASARQRFRREAEVLGRLEHPNIVPIHEQGVDDESRPFYTMKLVKGRTLRAILDDLKEGKVAAYLEWNLDALLNVFRKVGDAMAFAHSRGVVHRDLKPDNVMVGEFGEVLVMDWGLAKILDDAEGEAEDATLLEESGIDLGNLPVKDSSLTMDGAVLGTPQFMSPEQASGRMSEIDGRSDIFSLGAILYQILTLRPPIRGDSVEEVLGKVRSGAFEAPTHFNPAPVRKRRKEVDENDQTTLTRTTSGKLKHCPGGRVPEALSAVTMRAMEFEAADRYSSVTDLMNDIAAYQRGFATSVEQVGALGQLWLLMKRHRVVSSLLGVLLLVSVVFVVQLLASEERARKHAETAETEADNARRAKELAEQEAANARAAEATAREEQEATRQALAKARIALAEAAYRTGDVNALLRHLEDCPADLRDSTWRYLMASTDRQVRQITALTNRTIWNSPAIPGTRSRFVTVDDMGFVWEVDATTGLATEKYQIEERGRIHLDVSRKADRLLVAQQGANSFRVISFDTGETLLNGSVPKGGIEIVRFSTNDERVLIRTASPYSLHCLSARTGESIWALATAVRRFDCSPVAPLLVTGGLYKQTVELRSSETGELQRKFDQAEMTAVTRFTFSPDGRHFAAGDMSGNVLVWQVANGRVVRQLKVAGGRVQTLQITRSGLLVIATGADDITIGKKLQVFDLASGRLLETQLGVRPGAVEGILHPESGYLLFSGTAPSIWRIEDGRETLAIAGAHLPRQIGFLGSNHVFASSRVSPVSLFELAGTNAPQLVWRSGGVGTVAALSIVPGIPQAVAAFSNGRTRGYVRFGLSGEGGVARRKIPGLVKPAVSIALSGDGANMLLALKNGSVVEAATDSGIQRTVVKRRSQGNIKLVRHASDSRMIAVANGVRGPGRNGDILELWNLKTGVREQSLELEFVVNDLALDADRRRLVVVGEDWRIHFHETSSLKPVGEFRAHDQSIIAVAFHPSLPVLATASADLTIKLWNSDEGVLLDRYLGSRLGPVSLAFSPSGDQLAVGSSDKKTRVYRTDRLSSLLR